MTRLGAVREEVEIRRVMRVEHDEGYPRWWSWDALRRYFCILTGGCSWGKPYHDELLGRLHGGRSVRCWKCHTVWSNWENTHGNE